MIGLVRVCTCYELKELVSAHINTDTILPSCDEWIYSAELNLILFPLLLPDCLCRKQPAPQSPESSTQTNTKPPLTVNGEGSHVGLVVGQLMCGDAGEDGLSVLLGGHVMQDGGGGGQARGRLYLGAGGDHDGYIQRTRGEGKIKAVSCTNLTFTLRFDNKTEQIVLFVQVLVLWRVIPGDVRVFLGNYCSVIMFPVSFWYILLNCFCLMF